MLRNFGRDYAIKPKMMLLSDFEFQTELQEAGFTGFIYMFRANLRGELIPHEVGFRFENKEHAEIFMDSLIGWKERSEGNSKAISIEFVELNGGDYKIVIAPDMDLFIERMLPKQVREWINPISMMASRSLQVIDQSGNYRQFKDSYVEGRRIVVRYFVADDGGLRPSDKYFVKTEFSFYKEDELPKDSPAYFNLKAKDKRFTNRKAIPGDHPMLEPERRKTLKYFFPVLWDKLTTENWLQQTISNINKSYSKDQIIQAICNLTLFERLRKDTEVHIDISKPGHDVDLIRYLADTFESFDSYIPDDSYYTKQMIEKQIRLDSKYLKEQLKKP